MYMETDLLSEKICGILRSIPHIVGHLHDELTLSFVEDLIVEIIGERSGLGLVFHQDPTPIELCTVAANAAEVI
jgi:hypothetical protein